jgi:hypothetical protein
MNVHDIEITETEVTGRQTMDDLIPDEIARLLDKVVADGGYYSKKAVEALYNKGVTPAIPPPSNAVVQGKNNTQWHDKIAQYIKDKGTVYAFYKKYGYGVRSLLEAQISRIKRCIGSSLKTQKIKSQKREGVIISSIINQWNAFGRCICFKMG